MCFAAGLSPVVADAAVVGGDDDAVGTVAVSESAAAERVAGVVAVWTVGFEFAALGFVLAIWFELLALFGYSTVASFGAFVALGIVFVAVAAAVASFSNAA